MARPYKRKDKPGYWFDYFERPGLRKRVYLCKDKEAAKAPARKFETDAMLRRRGVIDPVADKLPAEDAKPLGKHVKDFLAALRGAKRTEKHVKMAEVRIQRVLTAVGAKRLSELSPSAVQRAVGQMVEVEGMALKTANGHVQAVKQLSRWAWLDGRARDYVLASVRSYNAATDRRRERRALTDAELSALLRVAYESGPVLGMAGPPTERCSTPWPQRRGSGRANWQARCRRASLWPGARPW